MQQETDEAWLGRLARQPAVTQVAAVLRALQQRGLAQPAVASGFTRTLLLGLPPTDIDIHYVGEVPTAVAGGWLVEILAAHGLGGEWDIWNMQEHDARITTTTFGYLAHFVSTIDCVYLAPDSRLYDLTGRGAADARARILSLTHLTVTGYDWTAGQLCYLYLEGCRRIFLYGLTPTHASAQALRASAALWPSCADDDRAYLCHRVREKLTPAQREQARPIYATYGWEHIFDDE